MAYDLQSKQQNGYVYIQIERGMYRLLKVSILVNKLICQCLSLHWYFKLLWCHVSPTSNSPLSLTNTQEKNMLSLCMKTRLQYKQKIGHAASTMTSLLIGTMMAFDILAPSCHILYTSNSQGKNMSAQQNFKIVPSGQLHIYMVQHHKDPHLLTIAPSLWWWQEMYTAGHQQLPLLWTSC